MVDCHTHLLPGVDDGLQTMQEACEALVRLELLGVRRVLLTPHVMEEYPLNTATFLKERFQALRCAYGGPIDLVLGAEYMLDGAFEGLLSDHELLPVFEDHLLVETSCMYCPVNFHELLHKIHAQGYHVILAHPERYVHMGDADYRLLKGLGVRFQLNLLSLVGAYGRQVQEKSRRLLLNDYYDYIGSDIHRLDHFSSALIGRRVSMKMLRKLNTLNQAVCDLSK